MRQSLHSKRQIHIETKPNKWYLLANIIAVLSIGLAAASRLTQSIAFIVKLCIHFCRSLTDIHSYPPNRRTEASWFMRRDCRWRAGSSTTHSIRTEDDHIIIETLPTQSLLDFSNERTKPFFLLLVAMAAHAIWSFAWPIKWDVVIMYIEKSLLFDIFPFFVIFVSTMCLDPSSAPSPCSSLTVFLFHSVSSCASTQNSLVWACIFSSFFEHARLFWTSFFCVEWIVFREHSVFVRCDLCLFRPFWIYFRSMMCFEFIFDETRSVIIMVILQIRSR